jgi:hypothetical protein
VYRAARQAHREHRSLARLARHGHVTAHQARELAREDKAEPRHNDARSGNRPEILEQPRLLIAPSRLTVSLFGVNWIRSSACCVGSVMTGDVEFWRQEPAAKAEAGSDT